MGQIKPFQTRDRSPKSYMTSEECRQRAAYLFATAYEMKPGTARQSTLKDACDYRMLAEMKKLFRTEDSSTSR
jgi:hypothetical protein